jgi:predicted DNA-binding antitoxin AbrB/MazE fold protein
MVSVRAIFRDGQLQLLDPVDLREGQEVELHILSDEQRRVRDALSDLLVQRNDAEVNRVDFDEAALQREIDDATHGITLSELIIDERHTGR